jgi:hypothetical protein
MSNLKLLTATISVFAAIALVGYSQASQTANPNLTGMYRCQPEPESCQNSGATFTVTQTGNTLDVKNDKGAIGQGTLTSNISISMGPPWNMLGVIAPDNRSVQWSNGTTWRKQ